MIPLKQDLSIFSRFQFEIPPVGVKFLFFRPEGVEPLSMDRHLSFCEMLTQAQQTRTPFYFSKENTETCVGKILLGMEDMEPFAESGQIGPRLEIFQELCRFLHAGQTTIRAGRLDHCRHSQPGRNRDEGYELFDR
jgi:hypothetical protein